MCYVAFFQKLMFCNPCLLGSQTSCNKNKKDKHKSDNKSEFFNGFLLYFCKNKP